MEEAGVRVRLNATAIHSEMAGNKIAAVDCFDRNGPFSVIPKRVIDCSGDGDISAKAGVPFAIGDRSGNMMAVTLSFHMIGVDWDSEFAGNDPYFQNFAAKGIAENRLHVDLAKLYLLQTPSNNM